ncbi:SEC14-like protein 4 [Nephila pilipes]|uniref:SEC14-like protein 4 n=1 Tax=Nephila pilipes TaxID=299642 RepID=A0A8X6QHC1_NEPPI|nr:SEC14-like protein 4 [Nephila pilipes]
MSLFQNITAKERSIIDELRRRTINDLSPKMLEDETVFYRFCKARDFNLKDAEDMLRKHIIWRNEMQLDTFLTDYKPPEVVEKYTPCNFLCFDKEDCLVRYNDYGQTDMIGIETCLYFLKIYQDNYPERIKRILMINANSYFSLPFSIIQSILSSAVLKKIRCYKTEGWKEDLLKIIDADDLPVFLGGNKTDPDGNPLCNTFIIHGRKIPESYYFCNYEKKLSMDSDAKTLIVARSSKEEINFVVSKVGSLLEWEFELKDRDIDFSLYFKENNLEDCVELIRKQRIDTCYETEKCFFKCEKLGIYTIVFDNTYSWIHQKEIYFKARLRVKSEAEN